jgi:hypothetical protein
MIPINLVFQWRLIFDKKLKETSLPCYLTWNYWLWKIRVRPYSTNDTQLILILGWSGGWFGTGLGSSSSNELISARLSCRDFLRSAPWFSVSARSIDRDSFWFRSGFRVRYQIFEPKVRELVHSSWFVRSSLLTLLYIGLAIELIFPNIFNVITDYLPFVN